MATMHRWKFSALAAAAAATVGLYSPNALALALGPITVQSALGEPLRAEINLPQITSSEAETLRVSPATPETFRAQGMEYSPAIPRIQIELQRRPNGRTVLRLTSDRPVNEPFVDLVVDANWNTGRVTRSYTMLFDPPSLRRAPATVAAEPQISATSQSAAGSVAPRPTASARVASQAPSASAPTGDPTVVVKAGDTAGRIANANRPADVSLDQMLVALLRANPDAFIQGNVNRIKAGAVLQMPSEAQANATSKGEARQILAAQSRDFSEFRRKLAGMVPAAEVASPSRAASGSVQAQVQDQRPTSAAPDKLTLSKGAIKGQKTTEEELAKRKQANEASARVEELSKNISDLSKLSTASAPVGESPAAAPSPTPASSPAGLTVPVAAAPPTSVEATAPMASAPAATASAPVEAASEMSAPASSPESAASAPAESAAVPAVTVAPPTPAPEPIEESGFLSGLVDDPMVPLVGGGLLALLLGFGAWRVIQRRRSSSGMDSSFLESRLQPDSFFGASGGQRVDTAGSDSTTGGSSMAYSPSQLDAGGDVDPVAEADVYLAYGRDLQAEEILKEAVRHNPARVSVHAKLGEIYAKRQDRKALEAVATEIHNLTNGEGPDWNRIAELGRDLDPENTLYQPGGRPSTSTASSAPGAVAGALPPDLDLDLDLELDLPDDALTEAPSVPAGGFAAAAEAKALFDSAPAPLEISEPKPQPDPMATQPVWTPPVAPAAAALAASPLATDLDMPMDLPPIDTLPHELERPAAAAKPYVPSDSGLMEFDLDSISLDLKTPGSDGIEAQDEEPTTASAELADDPMTTKLALAQEFNTIGDSDGARTLIEEVIAESSGALKARAQKMLSELG